MNSIRAFALGAASSHLESKVFDWNKAAELIRAHKPSVASAGLASDWEWTGGEIYRDGMVVADEYTYLASTWATPELDMDGDVVDCFCMASQCEWDSSTKWPESALALLNGEKKGGAK